MKLSRIIAIGLVCLFATGLARAQKSIRMATEQDVALLKSDLLAGQLEVNKTRLKDVLEKYGKPASIEDTEKKINLIYGDLNLEFQKQRLFRRWDRDYSHKPLYSDSIEDLRFDLEDGQIVGTMYPVTRLFKDYDEPTESYETQDDGEMSVYYYGELKLTFENVFLLKIWKGKNLVDTGDGVYQTAPAVSGAPSANTSAAPETPSATTPAAEQGSTP